MAEIGQILIDVCLSNGRCKPIFKNNKLSCSNNYNCIVCEFCGNLICKLEGYDFSKMPLYTISQVNIKLYLCNKCASYLIYDWTETSEERLEYDEQLQKKKFRFFYQEYDLKYEV